MPDTRVMHQRIHNLEGKMGGHNSPSILLTTRAAGVQPPCGNFQNVLSLEPKKFPSKLPRRVTDSKLVLSDRKRQSWNTTVPRPDPFRYGDPNPLDCHPWYSPKHPDYIHRPASLHGTPILPVVADSSGSLGLMLCTHESNLMLERSCNSSMSKRVRVDSLVAQNYPIYKDESLKTIAAYKEKKLPPTPLSERFMHVSPSFDQTQEQTLQIASDRPEGYTEDSLSFYEAEIARSTIEENITNSSQVAKSIKVPSATSICSSTGGAHSSRPIGSIDNIRPESSQPTQPRVKFSTGETSRIRVSLNSGLPKGWSNTHDRFIAYLETHAQLRKDGSIPVGTQKRRAYNTEDMIYMLHKKFPPFHNVIITGWAIDRRLSILELQENNYFNMPYRCYKDEEWGHDI